MSRATPLNWVKDVGGTHYLKQFGALVRNRDRDIYLLYCHLCGTNSHFGDVVLGLSGLIAHFDLVHGQDLSKLKTSLGKQPEKKEDDLCGISDKLHLHPKIIALKIVEQLVLRKPGVDSVTVAEPLVPTRLRSRLNAAKNQVQRALAEAENELALWALDPANLPQIHYVDSGSESDDSEIKSEGGEDPDSDNDDDGCDIKYIENFSRDRYEGRMAMASPYARLEGLSCIVKHPEGHWVVLLCPICSGNSRRRDGGDHFLSGAEGFLEHYKQAHSQVVPWNTDGREWILTLCAEQRESIDPRNPPAIRKVMTRSTNYDYETPSPIQAPPPVVAQGPALPIRTRVPQVVAPPTHTARPLGHIPASRHMLGSREPQYE
jgi:hypothetical protein